MNSLIQLSRALNEARAEREAAVAHAIAQTKADRMEAAADAKEEQLIKVSFNSDKLQIRLSFVNLQLITGCARHLFLLIKRTLR